LARRWIALGSGVVLGADTVAWHNSIEFIGAGLATLIANTSVVFVALGAWLILGERPLRLADVNVVVLH
jgi:drug/metabolite transporter (DMT)-like permease